MPFQRNTEEKTFEKFGMRFVMSVTTETRDAWKQVLRLSDGTEVDMSAPNWASKVPPGAQPSVDWVNAGNTVTQSFVDAVKVYDDEGLDGKDLFVLSTADGPILGIVLKESEELFTLLDPCVISFSEANGSIKLLPIFNVARVLMLNKAAVRAMSSPAELLVSAYPGFVIQNRMSKYQLKLKTPLAETGPTTTDATEAVAVR